MWAKPQPVNELESANGPKSLSPLVLVVEDNPINVRLLNSILQSSGYRTHLAADGNEGLLAVAEDRPILIVTDLEMPRMDGLTFTREIKSDATTTSIPVIGITVHATTEHRIQAK